MATCHCRVAATMSAAILRHLDASRIVADDDLIADDGKHRLMLSADDIIACKAHSPTVTRGERNDVGTPDSNGVALLAAGKRGDGTAQVSPRLNKGEISAGYEIRRC